MISTNPDQYVNTLPVKATKPVFDFNNLDRTTHSGLRGLAHA
jgi:hypothetical protein